MSQSWNANFSSSWLHAIHFRNSVNGFIGQFFVFFEDQSYVVVHQLLWWLYNCLRSILDNRRLIDHYFAKSITNLRWMENICSLFFISDLFQFHWVVGTQMVCREMRLNCIFVVFQSFYLLLHTVNYSSVCTVFEKCLNFRIVKMCLNYVMILKVRQISNKPSSLRQHNCM